MGEKRRAYEALAAQIERIVNPQPNVIPMRAHETARLPDAGRGEPAQPKLRNEKNNSTAAT
jgi:hypothetical protein